MAVEIVLEGGPADGKVYAMPSYPPEFYVSVMMRDINPFTADPNEPFDRRLTYVRVGDTNTYTCTEFDPVTEVIAFSAKMGLVMDQWQERMFREWWKK
jgi:hypothetical protein